MKPNPIPLPLFEIHLTVAPSAPQDSFEHLCDKLGVQCLVIVLPSGTSSRQPMTSSFVRGPFDRARCEAARLAAALEANGFAVLRTKIEQHGSLADAPATDVEAAKMPAAYFELHAKLTLPFGLRGDVVRETIGASGGYLSANLAKGTAERFLTYRAFGLGRTHADRRFDALVASLGALGVPVRGRVREYAVFDSNPELDRGWIDVP